MKRYPIQLLVLVALAAIFLFSFATNDAEASHFRGGHLTWSKVPGTTDTVNIKFRHFWRCCASSGRILDANGVRRHVVGRGSLVASGTDLSGGQWEIYENNVTIKLAGPSPHTLEMNPGCCRISSLVNAPDDNWRIQTIIDLASGQTGSTVSSLPPILQVAKGPNDISIPVGDPDGTDINCRLSTPQESSLLCDPGLTQNWNNTCTGGPAAVVTNDCRIVWDASNQAHKAKHGIQIALEQGNSRTSLDIIMEVNGGLVNNDPPTCTLDNNAPVNNTGAVGQLFSISATGTDPEGRNLRINHQGIPSGSILSPANGTTTSSPATATWSYTPSAPGETHAVTLTFTDDGNQTCQTSFTLSVPDNQPPEADAGVDQIIEQTGPGAMSVILDGSGSSDPDGDPLTYAWSGDATATGVNPTVLLGAGTHDITLTVSDGSASDSDSVQVIVQDTIAPVVSVSDRTEEATGPSTPVDISGDASATDAVGVTSGPTADNTGPFQVGTTVVTWTACDAAGNCGTATQNVTVVDTTPPVINNACLIDNLWPPDHRMVQVSTGSASDVADPNLVLSISVTSDQPVNGTGDGDTAPDWEVVDNGDNTYSVSLRAERAGNIGQRNYGITITATDDSENQSTASCAAFVLHDKGNNNSPAKKKVTEPSKKGKK